MFSPYKPSIAPFGEILTRHVAAKAYTDYSGGEGERLPVDPFDYIRKFMPVHGVRLPPYQVNDQLASGLNAILLTDPSLIL